MFLKIISRATQFPVTLFAYNKPSINIILQNKISPRSRHLDIPVTFSYEKLQQKYFSLHHMNTKLNAIDISTKATSGPTVTRHWTFLRGTRNHPPSHTSHHHYLHSSNEAVATLNSNKW